MARHDVDDAYAALQMKEWRIALHDGSVCDYSETWARDLAMDIK